MVEIESYGAGSLPGQPAVPGGGKSARKVLFPVGIFFMLFLIEAIMAAGAAGAYFLYAGAGRITEIVSDTRSHAETLAGALGAAAELSYRAKSYARLRDLLHDRIDGRTVDEAFFILKSGKLIAHSDRSRQGLRPGPGTPPGHGEERRGPVHRLQHRVEARSL